MSLPTAEDLMTSRVLTVGADWPVSRLASYLIEHEISGAPVVSEYGGVLGVVSLTDLVREESSTAAAGETSVAEASESQSEEPASPPSYFIGSDVMHGSRDVLRRIAEAETSTTVRDIMMPTIFTVEATAGVEDIADRMVRGHLHRLLVVKPGTKREVVGIVTAIDVMKWVRSADEPNEATGGTA